MLMIDARHVYRKVTRKIYDFSPEQQQNLLAVVWLHRGQTGRFVELVTRYLHDAADAALACFERPAADSERHQVEAGSGRGPSAADGDSGPSRSSASGGAPTGSDNGPSRSPATNGAPAGSAPARPLPAFVEAADALDAALRPFLEGRPVAGPHAEPLARFRDAAAAFAADAERFLSLTGDAIEPDDDTPPSTAKEHGADRPRGGDAAGPAADAPLSAAKTQRSPGTGGDAAEPEPNAVSPGALAAQVDRLEPLAERSRDLASQADQLHRLAVRLIETCEQECDARSSAAWNARTVTRARKAADETRREAVDALERVRYLWRQARWLTDRFPDAALRDVPGLVKLVDRAEIEANDWSLTPGRYVGVAPEEEDENFDFKAALREIHTELETLDAEAVTLAARIRKNFEELGI